MRRLFNRSPDLRWIGWPNIENAVFACFDTLREPCAQATNVATLQFLFNFTDLFFGRYNFSRFRGILVHHHIQGELHIALVATPKISDLIATLRRELQLLHIQTFSELHHNPCDGIGGGIEAG